MEAAEVGGVAGGAHVGWAGCRELRFFKRLEPTPQARRANKFVQTRKKDIVITLLPV